MAGVVALVPDLLFGSTVVAAAQSGGHDAALVADAEAARRELPGARLLIVDLTAEVPQRIELTRGLRYPGLRTLAFYSHVESEVRDRALQAGFDLVVPRSRMAREAAGLIEKLLRPG